MTKLSTKFKRWAHKCHVLDQIRSSAVDILWIACTLADGNLIDFLTAFLNGDYASMTLYGGLALLTRLAIRSLAFYILFKLKKANPELALPRDFAGEVVEVSETQVIPKISPTREPLPIRKKFD